MQVEERLARRELKFLLGEFYGGALGRRPVEWLWNRYGIARLVEVVTANEWGGSSERSSLVLKEEARRL